MGEPKFKSKLLKWGVESETMRDLMNATTKLSEQNALGISVEVTGLDRRVIICIIINITGRIINPSMFWLTPI